MAETGGRGLACDSFLARAPFVLGKRARLVVMRRFRGGVVLSWSLVLMRGVFAPPFRRLVRLRPG